MADIKNMPLAGFIVIVVIAVLFALALVLLFVVSARYRSLARRTSGNDVERGRFIGSLYESYAAAYKQYGQDVNTPAIITDCISTRLGGLMLCERFLNNSVSIFVTLGLFGTFLGLSLSVSSLTELISYSNSSEWLSVLDSVGGGLISALSGMGVAFYTSLVGAGCSIILTVVRTVLNPETEREKLETRLELWLDTEVAPTLATNAAKDDAQLVNRMINSLNSAVMDIRTALGAASDSFSEVTSRTAASLERAAERNRENLGEFDRSVAKFNDGIREFGEVDYNLRGSVERMDVAVRDLAGAMREINRRMEGSVK